MSCQTIRNTTAATITVQTITCAQARLYRHACFHEPVTHRPASGTTASITSM